VYTPYGSKFLKKSIFVQITSYHDYELEKTVADAINKSSKNNEIRFGIHSIYFEKNNIVIPDFPNVKYLISRAPENLGIGRGRHIANSLYSDEDYYFQVDAHSRFDQNWDEFLIDEVERYKSLGFSKPLITNYPKPYWYEGDEEKTRDHPEVVTQFSWRYEDRFKERRTPMQLSFKNPDDNVKSISVSGGCIFTEGLFQEPNKNIFADGEEIFMAARAFTEGFDLLLPSKTFMYHLYYGDEGKNQRRLVCHDWPEICGQLEAISKEEIFEVLSKGLIGRYRLGTVRTLKEYGEYAGLDFDTGEVLKKETTCSMG